MFEHQPGLRARPTSSFPSPAQDYDQGPVSLDRALISNPAATFVLRVDGDGLRSVGVMDGDELVVDRALDPRAGHVVVVAIEGQHRVGRLVTASEVGQGLHQTQPANHDRRAVGRQVAERGPWSGADGWCLATDDLVLPIPSGSIFFGVARYAIHHLLAGQPPRSSRPERARQSRYPADLGAGRSGGSAA